MVAIGLTGNLGAGKSLVAEIWSREREAVVIDADSLGREAVHPGSLALEALVRRFGMEILTPAGELDRRRMGEIAFAEREHLSALNAIVHPEIIRLVRERMAEARRSQARAVVVDAALILEFGFQSHLDFVVVVDAPREVRIERALARRKMSRETIERLMSYQLPAAELRAKADFVIDNRRDQEYLRRSALEVFDRMEELHEARQREARA